MLQFTKHAMRLSSLNVRRELAGKNPADGRTASDLKLVVKGGKDLLDKLSPHLRGSFYMADTDAQGILLPQALTKRIHPLLAQDSLAYDLKCAGYQVVIDHAGNEDSAIVLDGCQINEFRLNLEEGGDGGDHVQGAISPGHRPARSARRQAAAGSRRDDDAAEGAREGGDARA